MRPLSYGFQRRAALDLDQRHRIAQTETRMSLR